MKKSFSSLGKELARSLTDSEIDSVAGGVCEGYPGICCISDINGGNEVCYCDPLGEAESFGGGW